MTNHTPATSDGGVIEALDPCDLRRQCAASQSANHDSAPRCEPFGTHLRKRYCTMISRVEL